MFFGKKDQNKAFLQSDKIAKGLTSIFTGKKVNEETLEALEELLIMSDIKISIVNELMNCLKNTKFVSNMSLGELKQIIFDKLLDLLGQNSKTVFLELNQKPYVVLFLGVNGSGKTTTIGKVANTLAKNGKKVLLGACDTFRAGATEQLEVWSSRARADILTAQRPMEDPATVAYRALEKAQNEGYDVLLLDTAGRLQNNANLMDELEKMVRVLQKKDANLPHRTVLVLDANTGQNAHRQMEIFSKSVALDGVIVNKLDGTAKGGSLLSIASEAKKPIFAIGVGEGIDDIEDFDGEEFLKKVLAIE